MDITVETTIHADIETTWSAWTHEDDIKHWHHALDDWRTTHAEVELHEGGAFKTRVESKDGTQVVEHEGTFVQIIPHEFIEYKLEDDREVTVLFSAIDRKVKVVQTIEALPDHSNAEQRAEWQAILDRFADYVEAKSKNED